MTWSRYVDYRRSVSDFRTAASSEQSKKMLIVSIISKLVAHPISVAYSVGTKAKMPFYRTNDKNAYLVKLHKHLETIPNGDLFWINKNIKDVGVPKPTKAVKHVDLIEKEKAERRAENYAKDKAYYAKKRRPVE